MTQITLPTACESWLDALRLRATAVRSQTVSHRHYRIGPVPVSVCSDVPGIEDEFHALYSRYEVAVPARDEFHIDVGTRRSWRSGRRYHPILANGKEVAVVPNTASIMPHVEWALNGLIMQYLPNYFQIHASVLSLDDTGVIFAGRPGQGKSTLGAALLARGWSYLSDEFALIDPHMQLLVPYPKALCIKAGAFETLRRLGLPIDVRKIYFKGKKGRVALVNPFDVRDDAVSEPCRVGMIVFPEYRADRKPQLEPISRAQAVFELTHVAFNFVKFRTEGIELLADVVRQAHCYRLWTNDLHTTGDLLEAEMRAVRS